MRLTDAGENANRLVAAWITRHYREEGGNAHLRDCLDMTATDVDGHDGAYDCQTGCDYARLTAVVTCSHGERDEDFEYGDFGELADIITDIERDAV